MFLKVNILVIIHYIFNIIGLHKENKNFEHKINTCMGSYYENKEKPILEIGFHIKMWIFYHLKQLELLKNK